jgi:hypothetical protein
MAMQSDVRPGICPANATTVVLEGRTRLKGGLIQYGTTSTVQIRDGASNLVVFTAPGVAGVTPLNIPDQGIICKSNLTVVTSVGANVTVFYG